MQKMWMWFYNRFIRQKGLIVGERLHKLVEDGVIIGVSKSAIKGSSIDVRLHNILKVERNPIVRGESILTEPYNILEPGKTEINTYIHDLNKEPFILEPGQFILGGLEEVFNLPSHITAKFYFSSTVARCGGEHSAAIALKPGWPGRLTLELFNASQHHSIKLSTHMDIGCIEFTEHDPVTPYNGKFSNIMDVTGLK